MVRFIRKLFYYLKNNLWLFRSLPYTIFFNFHYLPFKQAIKLPILLYKPTLLKCAGCVKIESNNIKYGMIQLGHNKCSIYPNTGIHIENNGGTIIFKGRCFIGKDSFISVGNHGTISFGDRFESNAALKIACHYKIEFDKDVSLGFECMVLDTDFHQLSLVPSSNKKVHGDSKAYGSIFIGPSCWIGTRCTILKNTFLPAYCVVGSCSLLNKKYEIASYSFLAGIPAIVKKNGVFRDRDHDKVNYQFADED